MTDLDLTRYEGHTPGEWHVQECGYDTTYQADAYINGPEGCIAGVWGTRKASGQGHNALLIADAPLLLAEVRRLREENAALNGQLEQQLRRSEMASMKEADRLAALLQSHARLLEIALIVKAGGSPAEAFVRAAVAEAEAL